MIEGEWPREWLSFRLLARLARPAEPDQRCPLAHFLMLGLIEEDDVRLLRRCPCRKSDPDIMVMQSAEDRQRKNAPGGMDDLDTGESLASDRCVRVPL